MEARTLSRADLALLAAAVAPLRTRFVSLVVGAIVGGRGLHLLIQRDGRDYVLVAVETQGDAVVAEHRMPVAWDALDETVRLCVLRVYVAGVFEGHRRWRRRMAPRLAALGVALIPSPTAPAND